jgi:hypothetical protein
MIMMKQTRKLLTLLFTLICVIAAALYVGGEFFDMDIAWLSDCSRDTLFAVQTVVILLSLALVPLALRLFKFRRIHDDLVARKAQALKKWGTLRLLMLGLSLVGNTLLYYLFGTEPAFGYLAVITMLVLPFVVPTRKRCEAETTEEEPVENSDENEA